MALGETHIYSTTAKLPNNQLIWPLPSLPEIEEGILVYGKFIESVTILIVNQGNWAEHTYYVRYEVTTPNPEYPHKEISFIVKRGWPTPESGIRVKAMAYPFKGGGKGVHPQKRRASETHRLLQHPVIHTGITNPLLERDFVPLSLSRNFPHLPSPETSGPSGANGPYCWPRKGV